MSEKKTSTSSKKSAVKSEVSAAKKSSAKSKVSEAVVEVSKGSTSKRKHSLHPNYREISVVMTNGEKFVTRSTYSSDVMKLDIDITTHPAWTNESNFVNLKADKVSALLKKYDGLKFMKQ